MDIVSMTRLSPDAAPADALIEPLPPYVKLCRKKHLLASGLHAPFVSHGLNGHLDRSLRHAGLQLGSGRWVSALVDADDVVLLSWTAAGQQHLLDSMHAFCLSLGLTISPSKTEVVVFNGSSSDTWHVGKHVFSRSASFKYLGIVFFMSLAT